VFITNECVEERHPPFRQRKFTNNALYLTNGTAGGKKSHRGFQLVPTLVT